MQWADDLTRWFEDAQAGVGRAFEPTLRLGVTGLSRAGKTIFITSLVANLLARGRMKGLVAEREGRILAAMLAPSPDREAPRFDFERCRDALYAAEPSWPESTRSISQLRLSIRYRPGGFLGQLSGALTGDAALHLDIIDYPGEWLLDLALLPQSYAAWSEATLATAEARRARIPAAGDLVDWARAAPAEAPYQEADAQAGAARLRAYLAAAREAGFSGLAPGRFLLPGELEGAPALTFAPLPPPDRRAPAGALHTECAERFEAYKRVVAKPFFTDHFARLDRQIVLVDALSALSRGREAVADLSAALTEILAAFRPGSRSAALAWLAPILGRRIDRVLLAATKADHVHHRYHPALQRLVSDLLARTIDRAAFQGAEVQAMAIAAVRATVEEEIRQNGPFGGGLIGQAALPAVRGRLAETAKEARLFAGEPPETLAALSDAGWGDGDFAAAAFAPPRLERRDGEGPPHLRLDAALQFLIGDRLA
ncbi:MAG: YcjX family protein [Pseudomonadota bacterium]